MSILYGLGKILCTIQGHSFINTNNPKVIKCLMCGKEMRGL